MKKEELTAAGGTASVDTSASSDVEARNSLIATFVDPEGKLNEIRDEYAPKTPTKSNPTVTSAAQTSRIHPKSRLDPIL